MSDATPRKFTPEAYSAEYWEAEYRQASLKSEEWSKRLLTSLAVGNAAGLVAIASTLPESGDLAIWQLRTAQAFVFGVVCSGLAMLFRERFWSAKAYRYAWLAREPERFPADVKALVAWEGRPWWQKRFKPKAPITDVDPNHPALVVYWKSEWWNLFGEVAAILSALAFIAALCLAVWARG